MLDLFLNDKYIVLKLLYDNETEILGERIVPLTQIEISEKLGSGFSKMKMNAIFAELVLQGFICQKTRGKYTLTDKTRVLVSDLEELEAKLS